MEGPRPFWLRLVGLFDKLTRFRERLSPRRGHRPNFLYLEPLERRDVMSGAPPLAFADSYQAVHDRSLSVAAVPLPEMSATLAA